MGSTPRPDSSSGLSFDELYSLSETVSSSYAALFYNAFGRWGHFANLDTGMICVECALVDIFINNGGYGGDDIG